MKVICVDDEPLAVDYTLGQCKKLPDIDEVKGFTDASLALDWLQTHSVELAILDINMPQIDGITLAARIKENHPHTAILFLTAYKKYAFDAYSVHPAGYLLKPVSDKKLKEEVDYACGKDPTSIPVHMHPHIHIKTFGMFDVYVDDRPVRFKLAKAKEILAYLVDKQGAGVTRSDVFATVWEDQPYDRRMQKQLDVYIRSLRDTLREYGISEIMEMKKGILRIIPGTFVCDAYLFFSGDSLVINSYRGEYMSSYSWASITESILFWKASLPL